jgi:hypothetical protein
MLFVGLKSIKVFINPVTMARGTDMVLHSHRELRHIIELYYY